MEALLIIDVQEGLTKGKKLYNEEVFIDTVNSAIDKFRKKGDMIIFFQHNNKQLVKGKEEWKIDNRIDKKEDDIVLQKSHSDAFEKTDLQNILQENKIEEITISGLVSHGCVKHTCKDGIQRGFKTNLLANGHTNWNKDAQDKISFTEVELKKLGVKVIKE